jgi:hypothetical protein
MPSDSQYWYSLIAASPNPETEEAVNVAVVVGNGQAVHLVFHHDLPRLCGLANPADVALYRTVLESVQERVNRGIDPKELESLLGPQLTLKRPRALYRAPSDDLLIRLRRNYLEKPQGQSLEATVNALQRRSTAALLESLQGSVPFGVDVKEHVTPRKLYGPGIRSHVGFRVPPLARAVRFEHVDVLLDSVLVEPGNLGRALTVAAGRISEAFFAYNRELRPLIQQYSGRSVKLIGVLHPGPADDADTHHRRDFIKHTWKLDAQVIDGNTEDVRSAIREAIAAATS